MKAILTLFKLSLVFVSLIVLNSSCQKSFSEKSSLNNAAAQQKVDLTNTAINSSTSDEENFDLIMEDQENNYSSSNNAVTETLSDNGGTVTYSPSKDVYPHTKTIDYGAGLTGADGNTRSGKVIITYFNPSTIDKGRFTLTTYDNYYENGVHIEGHIRVHKDISKTGRPVYANFVLKTLSDGNGDVKNYNGYSKWTLTDWQASTNNAYKIDESDSGTETMNGIETSVFETHVDSLYPVIKPIGCKRVQGVLISTIHIDNPTDGNPSELQEYLDYGNGDCDNNATLTVNGGTPQLVNLPLLFWPLDL